MHKLLFLYGNAEKMSNNTAFNKPFYVAYVLYFITFFLGLVWHAIILILCYFPRSLKLCVAYPVQTSVMPDHCRSSGFSLCGTAVTVNHTGKAISPAAPPFGKSSLCVSQAAHTMLERTLEVCKHSEAPVKNEEQDLTPGSITSLSMESDMICSSEDDSEEDCYSSAAEASSSLPSPEVFRKENDGVFTCRSSITACGHFSNFCFFFLYQNL